MMREELQVYNAIDDLDANALKTLLDRCVMRDARAFAGIHCRPMDKLDETLQTFSRLDVLRMAENSIAFSAEDAYFRCGGAYEELESFDLEGYLLDLDSRRQEIAEYCCRYPKWVEEQLAGLDGFSGLNPARTALDVTVAANEVQEECHQAD